MAFQYEVRSVLFQGLSPSLFLVKVWKAASPLLSNLLPAQNTLNFQAHKCITTGNARLKLLAQQDFPANRKCPLDNVDSPLRCPPLDPVLGVNFRDAEGAVGLLAAGCRRLAYGMT